MTEMAEKKGRLKVTMELEVNEELMEVVKDAMSKASSRLPEMMRRGGNETKP
jgi:ribosomal protein L16/L10AE